MLGLAHGVKLLNKGRILNREDLRRQQGRIGAAVDGHGGHGHTGGHLHGGEQRVQAVQRGGLDRDADHRQCRLSREGARQMGCLACRTNHHAETVFPGGFCEIRSLHRGAVGAVNMGLKGNLQLLELFKCRLQDGQIAVAAHDDGNLLHTIPPLLRQSHKKSTVCKQSERAHAIQ